MFPSRLPKEWQENSQPKSRTYWVFTRGKKTKWSVFENSHSLSPKPPWHNSLVAILAFVVVCSLKDHFATLRKHSQLHSAVITEGPSSTHIFNFVHDRSGSGDSTVCQYQQKHHYDHSSSDSSFCHVRNRTWSMAGECSRTELHCSSKLHLLTPDPVPFVSVSDTKWIGMQSSNQICSLSLEI